MGPPILRALMHAFLALWLAAVMVASASELSELRRELEDVTGVSVSIPSSRYLDGPTMGAIDFVPLGAVDSRGGDAQQLAAHLRLAISQYRGYPKSLFKRVGLDWIAFVKNLRVGSEPRAASYVIWWSSPEHTAHGGVVLDIQQGARDAGYVRWSMHHELFHLIDQGVVPHEEIDRKWIQLNPSGFHYVLRRKPYTGKLEHPALGILTDYSSDTSWEDRAEMFAALMCTDEYPEFSAILDRDPIIRRKALAIVNFLASRDPAMGQAYFKRRLGTLWRKIDR